MKFRDSGMPSEELWKTFFQPTELLRQMNIDQKVKTLIDIGSGYGTFLLPAAELVSKDVVGIDIDEKLIAICRNKIQYEGFSNVHVINGDITNEETLKQLEKYKAETNYITLFNILHCEKPLDLLKSVYNILNKNGKIGVIHWKYEETPRGPAMEIRPKPETIVEWAASVGFTLSKQIDIPPYHFGLVFIK